MKILAFLLLLFQIPAPPLGVPPGAMPHTRPSVPWKPVAEPQHKKLYDIDVAFTVQKKFLGFRYSSSPEGFVRISEQRAPSGWWNSATIEIVNGHCQGTVFLDATLRDPDVIALNVLDAGMNEKNFIEIRIPQAQLEKSATVSGQVSLREDFTVLESVISAR